jgi:hypothetical protein
MRPSTTARPRTYAVKLLPCAPALAQCVALGLVRGIDAERRELFVYTAASSEALARVNTLVLGSVAVPTTHVGVATLSGGVASTAPYVSLEALSAMESGWRDDAPTFASARKSIETITIKNISSFLFAIFFPP